MNNFKFTMLFFILVLCWIPILCFGITSIFNTLWSTIWFLYALYWLVHCLESALVDHYCSKIKVTTFKQREQALNRIKELWNVKPGSNDGKKFIALGNAILKYDSQRSK